MRIVGWSVLAAFFAIILYIIAVANDIGGARMHFVNWNSKHDLQNGYYMLVTEDHSAFFPANKVGLYGPDIVKYEVYGSKIAMIDQVWDQHIDGKLERNFNGHFCRYIIHDMSKHDSFVTADFQEFLQQIERNERDEFALVQAKKCPAKR